MRHQLLRILLPGAICALVTACGSSSSTSSASSSAASATSSTATSTSAAASASAAAAVGFENVPLEQGPDLAPASTTGTATVHGIACAPTEQLAYHIHAHLAVFDDGRLYALPGGIGIPGSAPQQSQYGPVAGPGRCLYWLHTHTADGIVHIESPTRRVYTLGDFFDIWRQPLSRTRAGLLHGAITAYVNGHLWRASPRAIPLLSHEDIQLQIGEPAPPLLAVNWGATQL